MYFLYLRPQVGYYGLECASLYKFIDLQYKIYKSKILAKGNKNDLEKISEFNKIISNDNKLDQNIRDNLKYVFNNNYNIKYNNYNLSLDSNFRNT